MLYLRNCYIVIEKLLYYIWETVTLYLRNYYIVFEKLLYCIWETIILYLRNCYIVFEKLIYCIWETVILYLRNYYNVHEKLLYFIFFTRKSWQAKFPSVAKAWATCSSVVDLYPAALNKVIVWQFIFLSLYFSRFSWKIIPWYLYYKLIAEWPGVAREEKNLKKKDLKKLEKNARSFFSQ